MFLVRLFSDNPINLTRFLISRVNQRSIPTCQRTLTSLFHEFATPGLPDACTTKHAGDIFKRPITGHGVLDIFFRLPVVCDPLIRPLDHMNNSHGLALFWMGAPHAAILVHWFAMSLWGTGIPYVFTSELGLAHLTFLWWEGLTLPFMLASYSALLTGSGWASNSPHTLLLAPHKSAQQLK